MKAFCYSVGHSNYCYTQFRDLLQFHRTTLVVDVRSVPYSKFVPHYNREGLKSMLGQDGIKYIYAGQELGGRSNFSGSLDEVVQMEDFQAGIARVITNITGGEIVAIMCAEKDPFNCHRFFLITYALEDRGVEVRHILESGNAVPTQLLEERLMETYHDGLFQLSLFGEGEVQTDAVRRAYSRRYREVVGQWG